MGRFRDRVPLSLLIVAVPALVGIIRIALSLRRPFLAGGDAAFTELAVRQALRGRQLLGPYSRFGWNHPGPALFYLLAPWYWLSGRRSRALFLGSWIINTASAVAIVALVRRRFGEGTARLVAAAVGLLLLATGFGGLINPWNPSLLEFPFLLLVFLAADAATGSLASLVGGAAVGSYLVQTHIGILPVVVVVLALATAAWLAATAGTPERFDRRILLAGAGGLGLLWIGPIIDQLTHSPGNLRAIAGFFRHPPGGMPHVHALSDAVTAVAAGATAPFLGGTNGAGTGGGRVAAVVAAGVLGAGVAVVARKRNRFAAALLAFGAASLLVSVLATTRVTGDLEPYLFQWTPALLLLPATAAGILVLDRLRRPAARRSTSAPVLAWLRLPAAAAVVLIGARLVAGTVHHDTVSFADSPDAAPAARRIEAQVGQDRQRVFPIHVIDGQFQMSSLLLRLVLDGYHFRMSPSYGLYTGDTGRHPAPGAPTIVVGTAASPTPPGATPLGTVGPFVLTTVLTESPSP